MTMPLLLIRKSGNRAAMMPNWRMLWRRHTGRRACSSKPRKPGTRRQNSRAERQSDGRPPAGEAVWVAERKLRSRSGASLALCDLPYRPPRLIDGLIRIGIGSGIGVGDGNPPVRFARDFTRCLPAFQPERIEQRVVFVGVAVGPAIHRNRRDVAGRIEATGTKGAGQLIANLALHGLEVGRVEFHAAHDVLFPCGESRMACRLHHVYNDRLLGLSRALVTAHADR